MINFLGIVGLRRVGGSAGPEHGSTSRAIATTSTVAPLGYYEALEAALSELLIAKGLIKAVDIQRAVEALDAGSPAYGARLIARAWVDPGFKARLFENANLAAREFDCDAGPGRLIVVENTPHLHNLVVSSLGVSFPRALLGRAPAWYESAAYRSRAVREPRQVLAEFGADIPSYVEVRVHDAAADHVYLVLPMRPAGSEAFLEEDLAALVTRESMIGVQVPRLPGLLPNDGAASQVEA
ncbi:Nitrile hydratase [Rhodomicrobium vannielii ATCC 17100]|uniref:Nitrile hydratase n=1 Tax=Rhodomicrobium vannielii (strain ATCC 17100 / DSM 162 / LMG 4299 / NCIMB 10020 / ATH 3.1.1) TaxID=648757 RepID=E3I8A7_RHOVT|nr:nitrile hydratase subunit alpha [Rhodomicrobium vannielii]ADP69732.1 Nitrile hydratase [Rhodomicrobium vannielii ATCC 17100]